MYCNKTNPYSRGSLETGPRSKNRLRAVDELPETYRKVFAKFPYFNLIQSTVFDDVLHTDRPMVVAAPTGCGKTVIFELAIIRVLQMSADLGGAEIPGRNSMHFRTEIQSESFLKVNGVSSSIGTFLLVPKMCIESRARSRCGPRWSTWRR